jgi:hypothetical protein
MMRCERRILQKCYRNPKYPTLFRQIAQPKSNYLAIPKTSSERRSYLPMGYLSPTDIVSSELFTCPGATLYHFGVLSSAMHTAWLRVVAGRLKSDYRYSSTLVYNNFSWPESPSENARGKVEAAAQAVLDARAAYPSASLADLYDPLTMPAPLVKAHVALDRAVDRCYRRKAFASDQERVEHLFSLYEKLVAPLVPQERPRKRRKRRQSRA